MWHNLLVDELFSKLGFRGTLQKGVLKIHVIDEEFLYLFGSCDDDSGPESDDDSNSGPPVFFFDISQFEHV